MLTTKNLPPSLQRIFPKDQIQEMLNEADKTLASQSLEKDIEYAIRLHEMLCLMLGATGEYTAAKGHMSSVLILLTLKHKHCTTKDEQVL